MLLDYLFKTESIFDIPIIHTCGFFVRNIHFENGTKTRNLDLNTEDVTILIPCYKKQNYIVETVLSCLAQTVPVKVNVLLMDEESYKMKKKLESMGVKCYCTERKIVTQARTFLVDNCETDWFVFLDGDDLLAPNFVETLSKLDGAARFPSSVNEKNGVNYPCLPDEPTDIANTLAYNNTALIHKDVFYDLGGYDDNLCRGGEDTDFIIRLLLSDWKMNFCSDTYYVYQRETENNLTRDFDAFQTSVLACFRKNHIGIGKHITRKRDKENNISIVKYILEDMDYKKCAAFLLRSRYPELEYKVLFDVFKRNFTGIKNTEANRIENKDLKQYFDSLNLSDKLKDFADILIEAIHQDEMCLQKC